MVSFSYLIFVSRAPDESDIDVVRAISEAIDIVQNGLHDPIKAHERIKTFYNWEDVAIRTEKVYHTVLQSRQIELMERIRRSALSIMQHLRFT